MAKRIREQDLQEKVNVINNQLKIHDYQFHIDCAYGGVKLVKEILTGGIEEISSGYVTKRELNTFLEGFLEGMKWTFNKS